MPENIDLEAPASRLLDLGVFFKTMDLLYRESKTQETPELKQLLREGQKNARLYMDEFREEVETFLAPTFDLHGYKAFEKRWNRLRQPKLTIEANAARGDWITQLLGKLRRKQAVFHSTFGTGLVRQTAKKLAGVSDIFEPVEQAQALLDCRFTGTNTKTRRFCKQALTHLGAIQTDLDEVADDLSFSKRIADQLRATETLLDRTDPLNQERTEALEAEAQDLRDKITDVAMDSATPAAVMQVAAEATAETSNNFSTKTGEKFGLSAEQEMAMASRGKALVSATAGSGKTATLTAKVMYHINELDMDPSSIMATSFSSKSAYELMERIRKNGGESFMHSQYVLEGFGTTHSVSGKILAKYANRGYAFGEEAPLSKRVLKDGQETLMLKMAIEQVKMFPDRQPQKPQVVGFFGETAEQPEGVAAPETPAEEFSEDYVVPPENDWERSLKEVIAVHTANPGLPYADIAVRLSKDILRRGLSPDQLSDRQRFAINKAFQRANQSMRASLVTAAVALESAPTNVVSGARSNFWKNPANQWFNRGDKKSFEGKEAVTPKQAALAISKWKANLVTPTMAQAASPGVVAAIYGAYEWLKKNDPARPASRDHDDILIETCQLLVKDDSVRAAVQSRFKTVIVDEAQDQNAAQTLLFGLIAGEIDPKTRKRKEDGSMTADTYAIIGDPNQAIYGFRGAEADLFIDRDKRFGGDFETYTISTNYRSGSNIVDAANRLSEHFGKSIPMVCQPHESRGEGSIQAVQVPYQKDEGPYVAEQIAELIESGEYGASDFGVCLRTNAEAYSYCMELLRRGIPFRSKGSFFNDNSSKALILWLKLAESPESDTRTINEVVLGAYNVPSFGLDKAFGDNLQRFARGENYLEWLATGGWQQVYTGNQSWRNEKSVRPYVDALLNIQGANGSPVEILDMVMDIKGASPVKTKEPESFREALLRKTLDDPETRAALTNESMTGEIDMGSAAALAEAPIDPLRSVLSNYEDIGPAMQYVRELQEANQNTSKKNKPTKANQPDTEYEAPAVMVDTVHQWKGLEAPNVYVAMSENTFPHVKSLGDAKAMEAERRLAYVAITRGRDNVTVISHEIKKEGEEGKPNQLGGPSTFTKQACIPMRGGPSERTIEDIESDYPEDPENVELNAAIDEMIEEEHLRDLTEGSRKLLASIRSVDLED